MAMQVEGQVSAHSEFEPEVVSEPVELTILMPCLNEAETLAICIRKALAYLETSGVSGEVLVADNGSTDGSREIAAAEGARMVPVSERGYGAALIGGIKAAKGRYIIMGDADDSYDFSALQGFVDELRGGADLVMGNRFKGGIRPGAMPILHRLIGNPVLSFIGRLFFKIPVGDFHCGLRGFNRDAIRKLELSSTGMEFASEMVVKSAINGYELKEVPTTLDPDGRSRAPHLKTWRDGWRHLRFLLLHSPKWLFAFPGVVMLILGVVGVGALVGGAVSIGSIEFDIHTLVVACFAILVGSQLLMFSFVTRSFASMFGILPNTRKLEGVFGAFTLERMLQLSLVLVLLGLAGGVFTLLQWIGSGFGEMSEETSLRWFVLSLTVLTVGIQTAAAAFLSSFVRLKQPE
ncbi:MAG: glycosyltransferase family 2 protein [Pseudomonadota bacterium]